MQGGRTGRASHARGASLRSLEQRAPRPQHRVLRHVAPPVLHEGGGGRSGVCGVDVTGESCSGPLAVCRIRIDCPPPDHPAATPRTRTHSPTHLAQLHDGCTPHDGCPPSHHHHRPPLKHTTHKKRTHARAHPPTWHSCMMAPVYSSGVTMVAATVGSHTAATCTGGVPKGVGKGVGSHTTTKWVVGYASEPAHSEPLQFSSIVTSCTAAPTRTIQRPPHGPLCAEQARYCGALPGSTHTVTLTHTQAHTHNLFTACTIHPMLSHKHKTQTHTGRGRAGARAP